MDCELQSFSIVAIQENLWSNSKSCGSYTVESESIGNVRIGQNVFLTRLTVCATRLCQMGQIGLFEVEYVVPSRLAESNWNNIYTML